MGALRQMTLGFGAGAFGAAAMVLIAFVFGRVGIPEALGIGLAPRSLPEALYQLAVWGGIWGVLLAVPVLNRKWWLKGIIVGLLASAALIFHFQPALAGGTVAMIAYAILLNAIWGVAAGFWWWLVGTARDKGRYGSFIR